MSMALQIFPKESMSTACARTYVEKSESKVKQLGRWLLTYQLIAISTVFASFLRVTSNRTDVVERKQSLRDQGQSSSRGFSVQVQFPLQRAYLTLYIARFGGGDEAVQGGQKLPLRCFYLNRPVDNIISVAANRQQVIDMGPSSPQHW